jgi:hypothetical protein
MKKDPVWREDPMHGWFGLTYASYLVLPRVGLVSMPYNWQKRMAKLLEEMREAFYPDDLMPESSHYKVLLTNDKGQFIKDPLRHYRHHPKLKTK